MMTVTTLQQLIQSDPGRMRVLAQVQALALPDCWIGAGFVRNAVWDHLHGRQGRPHEGDVDVVWHDPDRCDEQIDRAIELCLRGSASEVDWSVKNQARMHVLNGDPAYGSVLDAMRYWPETATAVAVRLDANGQVDVAAAYGLDDLFGGVLRPTPHFRAVRRPVFDQRVRAKAWLSKWPDLRVQLI